MHRSEDRELLACAACGSEVDPRDAAYAYEGGHGALLCLRGEARGSV